MPLVYSETTRIGTSGTYITADIYMDASRNGHDVTVTATVVCTMSNTAGYIGTGYYANFNMWCSPASSSVVIKSPEETWRGTSEISRTRYCSMVIGTSGNTLDVGFNISVKPGQVALNIPDKAVTISVPPFNPPTPPSWISINPNPCSLDESPLITWGGASVGSLGRLYYDVETRAQKPNGEWTAWLRISENQSSASYQGTTIRNTNVWGQTFFPGIRFQYRVRSDDGSYSSSNWKESPFLDVTYSNPTAPTSYTLSDKKIKKNGNVSLSWFGATGGSGTISEYEVEYRIYNHNTVTWSDWLLGYVGTSLSYNFDLSSLYSVSSSTYYIKSNKNTSYVMGVLNSSKENNAGIVISQNTNLDSQKWRIEYMEDGTYKITSVNSGKCLDVPNGTPTVGEQLWQYTDNNTKAQRWLIIKNNDGTYIIVPKIGFNTCLDVRNGTIQDNNPIQLYTKNISPAQKFVLKTIDGSDFEKPVLTNGDLIQFRIRTKNSYGQYSDYLITTSVSVKANQARVLINGTYKECECFVLVNGEYKSSAPYVNINGIYKEST